MLQCLKRYTFRKKEVSKIINRISEILSKTTLFYHILSNELKPLLKEGEYSFKTLKATEEISLNNRLLIVVSGQLEAYKNEGGKKIFLKKINTSEITGIATLFDTSGQYISTFVAKKDSEILILSDSFVLSAIRTSPDFAENFSKLLCEKLRYLNSRIDTYTQSSVDDRLLEFIKTSSKKEDTRPFIEMSMMSLSSALGVGRASLYRSLASLEENGIISKEGKKIYLLK